MSRSPKPAANAFFGAFRSEAFRSEDGHTVAEAAVALALLTTVLVPTCLLLVFLTTSSRAADRSDALALARSALERAVAAEAFYEGQAVPLSGVHGSGGVGAWSGVARDVLAWGSPREVYRADSSTGRWTVARTAAHYDHLVVVEVAVYRGPARGAPEARLRTARLYDASAHDASAQATRAGEGP